MILYLILKCNHLVDIRHLDAPRILPESPFTLKCGNSDALSTLSASYLETYILTVTFCSNFLHCCIFSHPTYPKSSYIPLSLHLFTPQCGTLLSVLSTSLCPLTLTPLKQAGKVWRKFRVDDKVSIQRRASLRMEVQAKQNIQPN